MVNSKEIWKDIQGYEGLYQISNFGHVRSLICMKGGEYYLIWLKEDTKSG